METQFFKLENNESVAFFPNSGRFFRTNETAKELIESIVSGKKYEELPDSISISSEDFNKYYKLIEDYDKKREEKKEDNEEDYTPKTLDRLVIHVSNDCNLRCTYCYAMGGSYGSGRSIMALDIVEKTLDRFYGYFERIKTIQIFGGEPLYNIPAIKMICEYIRSYDKEHNFTTNIGLVTNATMIDDEFINIVDKYKIQVTVSYDGDEKVNNITRVYASGKGSSKEILEKTKRLYDATKQPNTIEVTYTQHHVENNVNITEIIKNIKKMFPETGVHLVPVSGQKTDNFVLKNYGIFGDSVDELFDMHSKGETYTYSLVERIISGIASHHKGLDYIFNAGVGTLSVSIKGDIYPCFMFTDEDALKLGNIEDNNVFESELFMNRLNKMYAFNKKSLNSKCSKCFMRSLCNGCLGLNACHENDEFKLNDDICDMYRDMVERAVIQCVKSNMMTEVS